VNVTGTPVLDQADTSDSLFAHAQVRQKYFAGYPEDLATVQRLSNDYWANSVLHVESLLRADQGKGCSFNIATAVFDSTKNPTIRTNILMVMKIATSSATEHKAFRAARPLPPRLEIVGQHIAGLAGNALITFAPKYCLKSTWPWRLAAQWDWTDRIPGQGRSEPFIDECIGARESPVCGSAGQGPQPRLQEAACLALRNLRRLVSLLEG
jgi:hypothetical protein